MNDIFKLIAKVNYFSTGRNFKIFDLYSLEELNALNEKDIKRNNQKLYSFINNSEQILGIEINKEVYNGELCPGGYNEYLVKDNAEIFKVLRQIIGNLAELKPGDKFRVNNLIKLDKLGILSNEEVTELNKNFALLTSYGDMVKCKYIHENEIYEYEKMS